MFWIVNVHSVMGFRSNQITCIIHIIVLHMLTYTTHICLLYKDTDVYSFMRKYNIIHSVFLTWYKSHLLVAMVFCPYGIFKSNLCLSWCFFPLRSSSLASYCCRQNSSVQSSHHQKSHQHCKTIVFLKLPSQSQISFKGSSQSYQISRFHQSSILSLRGSVRDILAHQHKPKPNSTLCASQVSYLYQKSISLGFSLLYIHIL